MSHGILINSQYHTTVQYPLATNPSLLFFHGRLTYIRTSFMIIFFFYKNILFTLMQFFFAFTCSFSRQSFYDDWVITFFNMLFTSTSIVIFSLIEHDLVSRKHERLKGDIYLYFFGKNNFGFNKFTFLGWISAAVVESVFIFLFLMGLDFSATSLLGFRTTDYEFLVIIVTTVIIFQIQIKLYLYTRNMTAVLFFCYLFFGFVSYITYCIITDYIFGFSYYRTIEIVWASPSFYVLLAFILMVLFMFNLFVLQFR